jgi:hypothetical protein
VDSGCLSSKHWTGFEVTAIGALPSLVELMKVATASGPKGKGFAWFAIEISKSGWVSIPIAGLEDVRNQVHRGLNQSGM